MTEQRVALVTEGNKGIGLEIARQLAQAGVHVVIGARDDERARVAVEELTQQGPSVDSVRIDLDDLSTVAPAADEIRSRHGRLDILVNNAGIFDFADAAPSEASIDAVRHVMEINFIGALAVTQAVLPLLREAPGARIVNVSSSLGSLALNGDPESNYYAQRYIGYNASKAALNMLTIQLNEELKGTGIVVNSVSPGFVKTDLTGYGNMTPEEGAAARATALEGAASGGFFEPDGTTPW
ncbi:SDR family oxidoreductase [Rhizobium ruizarguesonis]|uniref:SDR family oxidoreductase n=1 Tax=Rhizobium ruizarguesonis TaxID=2081791 RepID=UPI0003614E4B|nr:SDR family oxidoreductase [Rhizobium ruizarguesonis]TAY85877.1 SDR family oxidoreductase [Rhizobium ruizarguesonis]TAZ70240.1 SDR family oxidoreductase [Rhizobium ruizarguesonis]TAZ92699.1 SDR family oxidoreductase [Rhizobium ruizarguesonis]TBA11328.1 SDR family oxidoreductase [Rhizobium ruizarguesonis]TBA33856.1 SDR family oxidoreductase [Rhizobium ruizarguesonis]